MIRILLCINIGLSIGYAVVWFSMWSVLYLNSDFTAFYTGLVMVRDGLGNSLFDFDLQAFIQQNILEDKSFKDGLLPFVWSPHLIPVFIPLAWLPLKNAFLVFSSLQLIALIIAAIFIKKILHDFSLEIKLLFITLLTALFSTCATLVLGNHSLFILLSVLGFYYTMKKGNDFSAGAWLALGTIKPQLILMPVIMLMIGKNWRALSGFFLTVFPFMLISVYMLGWKIWLEYFNLLDEISGYMDFMGFYPSAMYNLKAVLYSVLGSQYDSEILFVSSLGLFFAMAVTSFLWYNKFNIRSADFELRFALTILIGLFFSPHLYGHDFVLFFVPLILLVIYAGNNRASLSLIKLFSFFPVLFFVTEMVFRIDFGIKIPTLVMIIMIIWISVRLWGYRAHAGQ